MSEMVPDKADLKDGELEHSDFLAWLMEPTESHGLKDEFVKKIIFGHIKECPISAEMDLSDISVYRESFNIDIRVVSHGYKFVIVIENKTISNEKDGQLEKYERIVDSIYSDFDRYYLFLTKKSQLPTRERWRSINYDDIKHIVESMIRGRKDSEITKILSAYIDVINGDASLSDSIFKNIKKRNDFVRNTSEENDLIYGPVNEILSEQSEKKILSLVHHRSYITFTTPLLENICEKIGVPNLLYYDLRLGKVGRPWISLYMCEENNENSNVREEWFSHLLDTDYYNNSKKLLYPSKKYIFSEWLCTATSHNEKRRDEIVDNLKLFFVAHLDSIDNVVKDIYKKINGVDDGIFTDIDSQRIVGKMKELSKYISYEFKDIRILEKAFYVRKMTDEESGANSDNYCNSSMATVGDAVLKLLIADHLYSDGMTKGAITKEKSKLESNKNFSSVSRKMGLEHYAFNEEFFFDEAPAERRIPDSTHNLYLESLVCAIYKDSGLEGCREWFEQVLFERLQTN